MHAPDRSTAPLQLNVRYYSTVWSFPPVYCTYTGLQTSTLDFPVSLRHPVLSCLGKKQEYSDVRGKGIMRFGWTKEALPNKNRVPYVLRDEIERQLGNMMTKGAITHVHPQWQSQLLWFLKSQLMAPLSTGFVLISEHGQVLHSSTKYTPYEMLFGRIANVPGKLQQAPQPFYNFYDIVQY
jgi:hypothetical protein